MEQKLLRRFYLKEFKAISHAIATYDDLNVLASHLAEGTARSFSAKGCSIMLFDDREKQLFPVATHGISEDYVRKGPIFVDVKESAFSKGEPVFVKDMQKDPRVQYPKEAAKEGIVSMLSVPIKSRGAVVGTIRIYQGEAKEFHDEDMEAMCVLAELLGLVIENSGLRNFFERVRGALESLPLRMLEGI
jgi:signal transduction protein with GAF and PtsI domain